MDYGEAIRTARDMQLVEKFRLIISILLLIISLWQLEIIYICQGVGWSYNFGGLGSFGLPLFIWRDFYYFIICFVWLLKPIKRIELLIYRPSNK